MDAIEMQITSAIERMPWLDSHDERKDSTSPLESPPTSPKSGSSVPTIRRQSRPGTRDSTQTTFTYDSGPPHKAMSIIGALHEGSVRRGLGSILDSDQVSNADRLMSHNRLDSISQRVAMIQAKVSRKEGCKC